MREDDALWTDEALRSDPRWEESRSLAAAALAASLVGVRPRAPLGGVEVETGGLVVVEGGRW